MKILLSYSTEHFTPGLAPAEHAYWGSSANVLARTLYDLLGEIGDVTYIDAGDLDDVRGQAFDVFVGVLKDFGRTLDACDIGRSILFAVNQHPAARNETLLDFVARTGLPANALHGWDLVDEPTASADVARADAVLAVGNVTTLNSYVRNGVDIRRLRVVNYATTTARQPRAERTPGPIRLIHVASEIGLRKGFDVLDRMLTTAVKRGLDFHFDLVGAASHGYYERRIDELREQLGEQMTWHGWLDPHGDDYERVLGGADVLLFPSLEEGQAGTALDAIARGVVPLTTAATGLDFAPLGTLEPTRDADHNVELLERACMLDDAALERLHRKTLEYAQEMHDGFREPLAAALHGAAHGSPWPLASVILPVFNKESTVRPLLELLDKALTAYERAELHVIVDGCTDQTEARVREFLSQPRAYATRISITPDIFEVKTNNIGLRAANGSYGVIVQDDNFIYAHDFLFEAMTFLEKNPTAAVLGGLAGVNFYPRGTRGLEGPGQIAMDEQETYWRQDAVTDPVLVDRVFEVDACMRGPLILRTSFLEQHGYLDEAYAPLYQDDMDLCMRAADRGFKVYCMLMDVDNDSGTMAAYSAERWAWMEPIMRRNTDLFYERWTPSTDKDYLRLQRTRIAKTGDARPGLRDRTLLLRRRWIRARKSWLHLGFLYPVVSRVGPAASAVASRLRRARRRR
ncbi:MAG TPA: glycosyltransferase [Solirubrobacteraceae bacterium]|nr:glycosyltransferase [Solirubrobacteraceae bacterium]